MPNQRRIQAQHYLALALKAQAKGQDAAAHALTQRAAEFLEQAASLTELKRQMPDDDDPSASMWQVGGAAVAEYEELAILAKICARNARLATTKNVVLGLWTMAIEYRARAMALDSGKSIDIGPPPPSLVQT
jgi:hypothetical protein